MGADDVQCELCSDTVDVSEAYSSGEFWMCERCFERSQKAFRECDHEWEATELDGEPAHYCKRCAHTVLDEDMDAVTGA